MDPDGPTKKYKDIYEFFKRVVVQAAEYEQLSKAALTRMQTLPATKRVRHQ